jgi:transposase
MEAQSMRGQDTKQTTLFSYISPEQRVPVDHPLRPIHAMMDELLVELSPHFTAIYSSAGRPSIAPERLLRALLLQVLYSIRSERMLMEQLDYNLLFRWFVGLNADEEVWHPTLYSHNRDRLLEGRIAEAFFQNVLALADKRQLVSKEHFTVDGTLVEAWAGMKSFKKKEEAASAPNDKGPDAPDDPGNPTVDFRGEKRSNQTHQSRTDKDARLYRKSNGTSSQLCYMGHVLMENRNGLVLDTRVTKASGTAEVDAALAMASKIPGQQRVTLGADKAYDTKDCVQGLRERDVTPHVAQNTTGRRSRIDARTTRHAGYAVSQTKRKRVEEIFGWMKTVGVMRKTRHKGVDRVGWMFKFTAAAYNLVRLRNLAQAV